MYTYQFKKKSSQMPCNKGGRKWKFFFASFFFFFLIVPQLCSTGKGLVFQENLHILDHGNCYHKPLWTADNTLCFPDSLSFE